MLYNFISGEKRDTLGMRNSEKIPKMSMLFSYEHKEKPKKNYVIFI